MSELNADEWQDLSYTPAVDRWITRSVQPWGEPEPNETRQFHRGTPFTDQEISHFLADGGTINRDNSRLAWQDELDQRAALRKNVRPLGRGLATIATPDPDGDLIPSGVPHPLDMIDITINALVSAWDYQRLLEKHRATVTQILDRPCNQRRRERPNMSTRERRHQQTLRLVHAVAFDGATVADYCRQHGIDKASASRGLKRLYAKEPELADAMGMITACAAATSWQIRQQKKMLRLLMKGAKKQLRLVYGWQYFASDQPFPSQAIPARMVKDGGGFHNLPLTPEDCEPCSGVLIDDDPDDLPREWWHDAFIVALFDIEPLPALPVTPAIYKECRELSHRVALKDGTSKVWRPIARAAPASPSWEPEGEPRLPGDNQFLKRIAPCTKQATTWRDEFRTVKKAEHHQVRRLPNHPLRPMCTPTRMTPLPRARTPHGKLPAFTVAPIKFFVQARKATGRDYQTFDAYVTYHGEPDAPLSEP